MQELKTYETPPDEDDSTDSDKEHGEMLFAAAANEPVALNNVIRRTLRTLEKKTITELGAIYLLLLVFLILVWRANKTLAKEAFQISQIIVTRALIKEAGASQIATGYDYWYQIKYPTLPEGVPKVAEYIEERGTRGEKIDDAINKKFYRFLKDQVGQISKLLNKETTYTEESPDAGTNPKRSNRADHGI